MACCVAAITLLLVALTPAQGGESAVPTTLDGPFAPVTVSSGNEDFRGNAIDLPETDPRVVRRVKGFEPEQISVSLSATADSVWISWVSGDFQMGKEIQPLNPETVASIVRYGRLRNHLAFKATGHSLIYNQMYAFKGMRNYTSGIIHHVRLTGWQNFSKTIEFEDFH